MSYLGNCTIGIAEGIPITFATDGWVSHYFWVNGNEKSYGWEAEFGTVPGTGRTTVLSTFIDKYSVYVSTSGIN